MEVLLEGLEHPERQDYYNFGIHHPTDGLVGYICFGPIPLTDHCYDLYWIAVDQRHAREGVGGRLLAFMEKFVRQKHARSIYIDTSSTAAYEAARSFYQKHGFKLACVLKDFYRCGDDKLIFSKEVASVETGSIDRDNSRKNLCGN
jgi:GNAT superfamily N-acetyltransferase